MPHVVSLTYTPEGIERKPADHYARVPLDRAELAVGRGIVGDLKGRNDSRQLNVMLAESLAELNHEGYKTGPGEMGEQIILAGLDPASLTPGTLVRLGDTAVIEISYPRVGCSRFEHIQGRPKVESRGRIGFMCRVVTDGIVHVGDAVTIETPSAVES